MNVVLEEYNVLPCIDVCFACDEDLAYALEVGIQQHGGVDPSLEYFIDDINK